MPTNGRALFWDRFQPKLGPTENPVSFKDGALCHEHPDPDLWYSEGSDDGRRGGNVESRMANNMARSYEALKLCAICPSKALCAKEGMRKENLDFGIWGGTMAGERLVMAGVPILSSENKNKVSFAKRMRERYGYL